MLDTTIRLDSRDSFIEFMSYESSEVIITGGISVPIQEAKKGTEITVKVPGKCGDVFLDDLRLIKARSPNVKEWTENMPIASGPYHTVTDLLETTDNCNMESNIFSQTCPHVNRQGFVFDDEFSEEWENLNETEVIIYHSWIAEIVKVAYLSHENSRNEVHFQEPLKHTEIGTYPTAGAFRFIILNNKALLDYPGEYICQQIDDFLTEVSFIPMADIETGILTMAQNHVLLLMDKANNVKISGLSFQHSSSQDVKDGYQWGSDSAVKILNTHDVVAENCEFSHIGVIGLYLANTDTVTIKQCFFNDVGSHAIQVMPIGESASKNILIENNILQGCGLTNFWQPACIWADIESNATIAHNDISGPPTGINFKSNKKGKSYWGDRNITSPARDDYINHVEFNKVHNFGNGILNDFGGIYLGPKGIACDEATLEEMEEWCYSYTHVYNNMINDGNAFFIGSAFLYSDVGLSRVTFENNILYGNIYIGIKHHCGLDNWSINNFLHSTSQTYYPNKDHFLLSGCGKDSFWEYQNHHNIYVMSNITNLSVFRPYQVKMHEINIWPK